MRSSRRRTTSTKVWSLARCRSFSTIRPHPSACRRISYWHIDTGFASLLMLLTAVDEGLGALFFGVRNEPAVRAAFRMPEHLTPIGAIAIGYPAPDEPSPSLRRGRRPVNEVVQRGSW